MDDALIREFNEYLKVTGGDKAVAASLTLAAVLRECCLGPPAAMPQSENVLTVAEAAKRLKVARKTVYELVTRGELGHHRIGRAIRILPADIDAYQRQEAEAVRPRPPVWKSRHGF
jgi:excisionase family DNA binding protein